MLWIKSHVGQEAEGHVCTYGTCSLHCPLSKERERAQRGRRSVFRHGWTPRLLLLWKWHSFRHTGEWKPVNNHNFPERETCPTLLGLPERSPRPPPRPAVWGPSGAAHWRSAAGHHYFSHSALVCLLMSWEPYIKFPYKKQRFTLLYSHSHHMTQPVVLSAESPLATLRYNHQVVFTGSHYSLFMACVVLSFFGNKQHLF